MTADWLKVEAEKTGVRCKECNLVYDEVMDGPDWDALTERHRSCVDDRAYYEETGD